MSDPFRDMAPVSYKRHQKVVRLLKNVNDKYEALESAVFKRALDFKLRELEYEEALQEHRLRYIPIAAFCFWLGFLVSYVIR